MSFLSQFSDQTGTPILIKQYSPSDSTRLSKLFTTADQIYEVHGLIHAKTVFNSPFHTRIEKFKESVIIYAEPAAVPKLPLEDQEDNIPFGSVQLGIKEAFINGVPQKIGVITNLKLLPKVMDQGIGGKLIEEIENQGRKKGVTMFYYDVNQNNENSKDIFTRLGYEQSLESFNYMKRFLSSPFGGGTKAVVSEGLQFHEVSKDRAKELFRQHFEKKDFLLKNLDEYFENPDYEGTYIAQTANGDTYGGVSLFAEPKESQWQLKRFIFTPEFAFNKAAQVPVMSTISLFSVALYYMLNGKFGVASTISATIAIGCNLGLLFAYTKLLNNIRGSSGREPRCRYVGSFYKGNEEQKESVFRYLFSNMDQTALSKGYNRAFMRLDKNDNVGNFLPDGWVRDFKNTLFSKFVGKQEASPFKSENFSFQDPRDW